MLPHGERLDFLMAGAVSGMFQFALPHGERRWMTRKNGMSCRFQFALPHGERHGIAAHQLIHQPVSIRAPAWGATRSMPSSPPPTRCFNSRSRMGSDCHHAMTGTACIESALFASQAGKVLWGKMQFVYHVFKSISIHHAISAANTPAFR